MTVPVEDRPTPRYCYAPTVSGVLRQYFTAAAALDSANGVIGTLDTTPTAAECDALMIHGTWDAALDIREVLINLSNHSGLVCAGVAVALNPGDAIIAGDRLVSGGNGAFLVQPGDAFPNGPFNAAVTDIYIVFRNSGGGSGYTGALLEVLGVSHA